MTEAARKLAVDDLGKAVARVLELGIQAHPLAESLMGQLDRGEITLRLVVEVAGEMEVRALVVRGDGGEPLELFKVGPGPRGKPN